MLNKRLGLVITILMAGAMLLSACGSVGAPLAQAAGSTPGRTITVVGQGKASGTPDIAHINIGVETTGASAQEAVSSNSTQMATLLAKLKAMGIADKDIQTSNYSIYTEQPQPKPGLPGSNTTGNEAPIYHVSNQVNVTVRDTSKLGDVLDQAVSAGANNVYGVNFEVSDTTKLEADARANAMADAKTRAQNLAQLAGVSLGDVQTVSEVIGSPMPLYAQSAIGMGGGGTPIQPGEFQVNMSVQVTYAIK